MLPRHALLRLGLGALAAAVLIAPLGPVALAAAPVPAAAPRAAVPADRLGYDRIGVRRGDTWLLGDSLAGGATDGYAEDTAGWVPVAGDTDGDGTGTVSLFRDGVWRIRDSRGGPVRTFRFGLKGDIPVLGDWNGDGTATVGVFRRGRWYLRDANSSGPSRSFGYGAPGDKPVVGDWNGDGRTDIAVLRGNRWFQRDDASGGPSTRTFVYGISGDLPVAGDWNHDGRDTAGLFRNGAWIFPQDNGSRSSQVVYLGARGDRPVVRRTPGLAPGVSHRVVSVGSTVAHVTSVQLAAASSPDVVLAGDRLPGTETTSAMARRRGAVAAVNGDYALPNGRPVHLFAADGRLVQTPQVLGRAFGIDASGTRVSMGFPDVRVSVTAQTPATQTSVLDVRRFNSGGPDGDAYAAYTAVGGGLEVPPADACYAGLAAAGAPRVGADGAVHTDLTVTGTRCGGDAPLVPASGLVLAADASSAGAGLVRGMQRGGPASLSTLLGFPGAVDAMGGNPLLLKDGVQQRQDFTGPGGFFAPNPRTAVGVTADGVLLLVVVDGRENGYSTGATLQDLADLMTSLGARDAINLDGGGSSTMWINGLVVNRPSDGSERPVSSALVVLPGADPGQSDVTVDHRAALRGAGPGGADSGADSGGAGPARSTGPGADVGPAGPTSPSFRAEAGDPASTGGLADALATRGVPLPPGLQVAQRLYTGAR